MKLTFTFFAILAVSGFLTVSSGPVATSKTIRQHLRDFIDLMPAEDLENLFLDYLSEDEDFQEALDYVLGDEFTSHVVTIEGAADFKNFLNFLEKLGVPAYEFVNKFNAQLNIDPISPLMRVTSSRITGGLPGFFKDIKALVPVEKVQELYNDKLANAPEFAEFAKQLQSKECYNLFVKILDNPSAKEVIGKAKSKGIDFKAILDFISSIFGFKFPPRALALASKGLEQHFDDFIALLPTEEFENLFYDYLAEDEDFAITLDYLMSEEFKSKLQSIESTSEFKAQLNFLEKSGLTAYKYVNVLNAFLGIELISPMRHVMSSRITGGFPGLIKDVKALLPVDEIKKLYNEKMANAPDFASFINNLQSEEYYGLVDQLLKNKEVQYLVNKAESKGVDFKAILDFIASVFGFQFPNPQSLASRGLAEDFEEFKKLIPEKKIEELFYDYLAEDEDFSEALDFLMGEQFKSQLITVESTAEFKEYLNFLEKSGLPAYETVNKVNAFLGIDLITPLRRLMSSRITGGLPGFLQDLKALLPLDDIQKLYNEKLKTSEQFAELVQSLKSEESFNLFAKLLLVPTIQDLLTLAESKGVDIEAIIDLISSMFGFKFPPFP